MEKFGVKIKGIVKHGEMFLILNHWYDDRIEDPYQWEFLDTTIEEGERAETACLRCIQESTGLSAEITEISYTWTYRLGDSRYMGIAFVCEASDIMIMLSEELHDYKWVTKQEIEEYVQNQPLLKDMKAAGII